MPAHKTSSTWTTGESDVLRRMWESGSTKSDIARVIRTKTASAIQNKLFALDLYGKGPRVKIPFTMRQLDTLRTLYEFGTPVSKIARTLGRSIRSIQQQACKMGLRRRGRTRWTHGQRIAIQEMTDNLLLAISKRFGCKPYAGKSIVQSALFTFSTRHLPPEAWPMQDWEKESRDRRESKRRANKAKSR